MSNEKIAKFVVEFILFIVSVFVLFALLEFEIFSEKQLLIAGLSMVWAKQMITDIIKEVKEEKENDKN